MSDQVESVVLAERQTIQLPSIGDYKDAPVVELLARPGDMIAVDDPLIVLESDKATIEVPSPVSGRLVELLVDVGMRLSEGSPFAVVEGLAASKPAPAAPEPEVPATTEAPAKAMAPTAPPPPAAAPSPGEANPVLGAVHASPSVRALARELGVSLAEVPPSGRKGRILRDDVFGLVKRRLAQPSGGLSVPEMPVVDFARFGAVERVPLSRIQQISGSSLHRNWVTIPHVTNFDEADVSDIETFRVGVNAERREPPVKLTMLAFLAKASAIALKQHPRFNASLDGDALVLKKYVHIGVAVDTPRGFSSRSFATATARGSSRSGPRSRRSPRRPAPASSHLPTWRAAASRSRRWAASAGPASRRSSMRPRLPFWARRAPGCSSNGAAATSVRG